MPDEPDAVQTQMDIQSAVDEAVRNIREHALRQVMVMVSRLKPNPIDISAQLDNYKTGHLHACWQIYDEIEAMIAKDAAT